MEIVEVMEEMVGEEENSLNKLEYIGATLTGVAALATASVTVYNTIDKKQEQVVEYQRACRIYDKDGWTNLRQLPSSDSRILTRLANDTEVQIVSESGNWFQIRTGSNVTGFVYKENILESD